MCLQVLCSRDRGHPALIKDSNVVNLQCIWNLRYALKGSRNLMLAQVTGKLVFSASKGLHFSADPQRQATTSNRSPCSSATTLPLTVSMRHFGERHV